jgi:hypothetical protein
VSATQTIPRIAPSYKESFARYASPEAIRAHLAARCAERAGLDQHIAWLEDLLARREGAQR